MYLLLVCRYWFSRVIQLHQKKEEKNNFSLFFKRWFFLLLLRYLHKIFRCLFCSDAVCRFRLQFICFQQSRQCGESFCPICGRVRFQQPNSLVFLQEKYEACNSGNDRDDYDGRQSILQAEFNTNLRESQKYSKWNLLNYTRIVCSHPTALATHSHECYEKNSDEIINAELCKYRLCMGCHFGCCNVHRSVDR